MSACDVLVMDSGSGGLSIWQALVTAMPTVNTVYLADFAYYPYGEQTEAALTERLRYLVARCIEVWQPKIAVIACNTASTVVLDALRAQFPLPFVGVVPAIKVAALASQVQCIGLLATPGTVRRSYIDRLVEQFAPDCRIIKVGSSELVHMAERQIRGSSEARSQLSREDVDALRRIIEPFAVAGCDQVVLGCTHFPLLRSEFEQALPGIGWVDSTAAICRRIEVLWLSHGAAAADESYSDGDRSHRFIYTEPQAAIRADQQQIARLDMRWRSAMQTMGFTAIQCLE